MMKMRMLAVSTAALLCAASSGAFAQASAGNSATNPASTVAAPASSMLCSDFTKLSADAQDAFLKGYQLGIEQNGGVSNEMTGAIGAAAGASAVGTPATAGVATATDNSANMASNTAAAPAAGATDTANPAWPDVASLTASCSGNDSNPISQYLGNASSVSQ